MVMIVKDVMLNVPVVLHTINVVMMDVLILENNLLQLVHVQSDISKFLNIVKHVTINV
jgi:hypothetical protein